MSQPLIRSGWWSAPAGFPLTPSGNAKRSEVDNPYMTKDEFIATPEAMGANITSTDRLYTNGMLDKYILRASAWVNRYCQRWFDTQTIDEIQTGFTVKPFNPELVTVETRNAPIQSIDSIYIQVLQWFIQVQTTPIQNSYLQIMPDWGVFKIVPLLSSAGSGTGSPIPAAILDKRKLGNLWYAYTFGFGQKITGYTCAEITPNTIYQPADYLYRLWAPDQIVSVYIDGTLQASSSYKIDYPNGLITFNADIGTGHIVTADFITNNTIPDDIKYAVTKLTIKFILQGLQNPMGFKSINITGYSVSFGDEYLEEIKNILKPYRRNILTFI